MGLITFTNITCLVFFMYLAFVGKNFYDIFCPDECDETDKNAKCIKPIPNWESNYKVCFELNFKKNTNFILNILFM
jgi:hypothetical protein